MVELSHGTRRATVRYEAKHAEFVVTCYEAASKRPEVVQYFMTRRRATDMAKYFINSQSTGR